jgi:hypothetical protein
MITRFGEMTSGVSMTFASVVGVKPWTVVRTANVELVGRVTVPDVGGPVGPVGETTHALLLPTGVENGSRSPTLTVPPVSVLWPTIVTKFCPCRTCTGALPSICTSPGRNEITTSTQPFESDVAVPARWPSTRNFTVVSGLKPHTHDALLAPDGVHPSDGPVGMPGVAGLPG